MKTKILSVLLAIMMIASVCTCFTAGVSAADGIAKAANAVFVADFGSDEAAGTAAAPVQTMQKAVEKLPNGGVVVVMGVTTIDTTNSVMPAHEGTIIVTSYYDGVDYRAKLSGGDKVGARLNMTNAANSSFSLHGDYEFDFINFCILEKAHNNSIIAGNYNNITFGANVGTLYEDADGNTWYDGTFGLDTAARKYPPIFMCGSNKDDSTGAQTITGKVVVNVHGGDWQSLRMGDRDLAERNTLDCELELNITGGRVVSFTANIFDQINSNLCVLALYQANSTANCKSTVNITGGQFFGNISAIGAFNYQSQGNVEQHGTFIVNILGGTFSREYNYDGTYLVPTQYTDPTITQTSATVTYGPTCNVTFNIDTTKITMDPVEALVMGYITDCPFPVNVNVTEKKDWFYTDGYAEDAIKYGPLPEKTETPTTTTAPTVTDAPVVTTEAPVVTTAAPVVTTAAPTQAEPTPSTGDASIMVVFAAAAVVCLAAVVVIKKREN